MKVESRKFAKFLNLSGRERRLFLEALIFQIGIGLLLKIVPFRWVPRLFANKDKRQKTKDKSFENSKPGAWNPPGGVHGPEPEILNLIRAAIQRSAPYSPWRNKCLVQSLAARRMLNRRRIGSLLSLGVTRDNDGKTVAHAWIRAGRIEIVSAQTGYAELYSF